MKRKRQYDKQPQAFRIGVMKGCVAYIWLIILLIMSFSIVFVLFAGQN